MGSAPRVAPTRFNNFFTVFFPVPSPHVFVSVKEQRNQVVTGVCFHGLWCGRLLFCFVRFPICYERLTRLPTSSPCPLGTPLCVISYRCGRLSCQGFLTGQTPAKRQPRGQECGRMALSGSWRSTGGGWGAQVAHVCWDHLRDCFPSLLYV